MDSEATSPAPPLSSTQGTPTPIFASSQEGSQPHEAPKQENGAELEGPVHREGVPGKELGGGSAEEEEALRGSNGEQTLLPGSLTADPPATPEDDGLAEEVLDQGPAGDADGCSSPSLVVGDTPPLPSLGEAAGSSGLVVGGADGVVEGNLGGDDEKEGSPAAARASDGGSNLELKAEGGFLGAEDEGEEKALVDGSANELGESIREGAFSERSIGEESNKDAGLHDHLADDGAPPTDSSDPIGTGDGAAAVLEGEILQGPQEGSHVNDAKGSVGEVAEGLLGVDAESEVTAEKSGVGCGAGVDDDLDAASTVDSGPLMPAFDSSKNVQGAGDIDKDEALGGVAVPADPGEEEHSTQKHNLLGNTGGAEENFPSGHKDEINEIEQASAKLEENSENGKSKLDADEGDMSSSREVGPTEQAGSYSSVVSEVALHENAPTGSVTDLKQKDIDDGSEAAHDGKHMGLNEEGSEEDGAATDTSADIAVLGSSEAAKRIIKELGEVSLGPSSGFKSSNDYSDEIDGPIVSDSDEEVLSDEEGDGKELFDSAALTALLKAATGASSDNGVTITNQDATRIFSVDRPAGLGSSVPALKPAPPRTNRMNIFSPSDLAAVGEPENDMDEEEKKLQEKVDEIRVKFLRLVHRLGHSPEDRVAAQVLYRLGLAEGIRRGRQIGRALGLENAKKKALQLEEEGKEPLDFSCNILVLGKTGVGKSATINSIFGEEKVHTSAFHPATTSIREIIGTVDGVNVRVIDTPGLRSSVMDQTTNKRVLASIQKHTKKCPPDIVLYIDRLDTQTWDFNDLPLLKSIAETMGSSIWFNAIVALTHAASAPPDGPSGSPLSYEVFVDQRSRIVQHAIRQAAGDMRLMNPVALVENHPSCRRNREGQRVLPNGLSWRTQMLLLCYSSKILSEANYILKLQEPSSGKLFGFRVRSPPLPFLLSSLLQSRAHPKLATDQGGDNGDSDIDVGDLSDSDQEQEEDEYDQLPPFKPLRKAQIAKLTKEQRKAYFDEYDYRVKLLQKKQWKEELRRSKELKKRGQAGQDESGYNDMADDFDQDGAPAAIPVPLPDMVLPPSFDCDNPAYRYRFLEPTSQLLVRPVLDSHGWDHDCGYDGVSLEENLAVLSKFPAGISVQVTKDKKEFNIHLDSSISAKHGETGSTLAGFDIQSVGKQLAYILRSETKFKNLRKNRTAAGVSVTFLGENIATGLKVEDQLAVGKRLGIVASTGAVRAQGDAAYGANLEMRLRDKDFPIGQDLSTLGLSLMKWRRDLALGANLQSQFSIGGNSKIAVRVGLNNKLSGQITVRTSTSEQLQLALLGILPIAISLYRSIWSGESD